jgi:hypothetical protein
MICIEANMARPGIIHRDLDRCDFKKLDPMDRLTIPLGPADQKTWPLWTGREYWLIAERLGEHPRSA